MEILNFNRNMAQLALLQRIELASPLLKRLRKIFGRYLFSKFFSNFLINVKKISEDYSILMAKEVSSISNFLNQNQNILSIGGGMGGLEIIIMKRY
mgnify:CR=1 FL=1